MKTRWFDQFVEKLNQIYSRIVIIEDQDELRKIPEVNDALKGHFILYEYKGEMALRHFLASQEDRQVLIFVQGPSVYFPYSIESKAERISWKLSEIFPGLHIPILRDYAKNLQEIYKEFRGYNMVEKLSSDETLKMVLKVLFKYDSDQFEGIEGAIYLAIIVYDKLSHIPPSIKQYVRNNVPNFPANILDDRAKFNNWLSDEWSKFNVCKEKGPPGIDFNNPLLRAAIDRLVEKGEIGLIKYAAGDSKGISKENKNNLDELMNLLDELESLLKKNNSNWEDIAIKWGRLSFLKDMFYDMVNIDIERISKVDKEMSAKFRKYIMEDYYKVFYDSFYERPKTLNKILPYIGEQQPSKMVLICIDGMGFQEWFCIYEHIKNKIQGEFKLSPVYSMLPSITSYSRKALFSGKTPVSVFQETEEKSFYDYMANCWDLEKSAHVIFLNKGNDDYGEECYSTDFVGMVFHFVDELAHTINIVGSTYSAISSKRLMQYNLKNTLDEIKLELYIQNFLNRGYRVCITSDHGSVWCVGNGIKADKYLVEEWAKRVLIYESKALAQEFAQKEDLPIYENEGLIGNKILVFPKYRDMFAQKEYRAISHGGIHIEEMIVPFVEVYK